MRFSSISPFNPHNKLAALGRGLLGGLMMGFALGLAMTVGKALEHFFDISESFRIATEAGYCSVFAAALILYFRCRVDQLPLRKLGFPGTRKNLNSFGLGLMITLGSALFIFGTGWLAGWIQIGQIAWGTYLLFIGKTLLIAFFIEAFPEELTLRGYSYKSLNAGFSKWGAVLWTIPFFLIVPGIAYSIHAATGNILLDLSLTPSVAPPGQDLISYFILLIFFGITLIIARIVTSSLWASIAVHLSFLIVNRTLLESANISGWEVSLVSENALLLIPAYLVLTSMLFLLTGRFCGIHVGWKEENPEAPGEFEKLNKQIEH